jgi:AraC family chitin signaling transcriptional activator
MVRKLVFIFFLYFGNSVWSQFSNIPGTPIIKNFTEEEVNNNLTIFDISQSSQGIMYFATPNGLLEYDGVRWENYRHGLESDLRSVLYTADEHIYTSGHGGFGYWSRNSVGELEYTSLFLKLPEKKAPLLPIFSRIKEINDKIFFQSFQQIFIYDPITKDLDVVAANKGFNFLFSSEERVFIQETGIGLFELKDKELILIEGTDKTALHILNVFVKNNDELLIVTKNNGFWSWKNKRLVKNKW